MNLIEIKKLKLVIHPLFIALVITMIALGYIEQFFILLIIVTIHEVSHILVAKLYGIKLIRLVIYPIGEMAVLENMFLIKPIKRLAIICAGPLINILLGIAFSFAGKSDILRFITISNFLIGAFNILPIYPLDGGKIVHLILSNTIGILNSNDTILVISKICVVFMFLLGIIQVVLYPYNISLICISLYLKYDLKKESYNLSLDFFRSLFSKSEFLSKYGVMKTDIITVKDDINIKTILRYFKSDKICKVHMVDKDLNSIGDITENQIINLIFDHGSEVNEQRTDYTNYDQNLADN